MRCIDMTKINRKRFVVTIYATKVVSSFVGVEMDFNNICSMIPKQ